MYIILHLHRVIRTKLLILYQEKRAKFDCLLNIALIKTLSAKNTEQSARELTVIYGRLAEFSIKLTKVKVIAVTK